MTIPPLLVAMAGRKPRARRERVSAPRESKLHVQVADLLRAHCLPDWKWRHISAKAKDAREGAILKTMGVVPGWPDFILISPQGSVRFVELKRAREEPSEPQMEFRMWCVSRGIPHAISRSIDDVLRTLDIWGCLRIKYERRV